MKVWTAMKRLNHRYDAWAMQTADKVVDTLDHRGEDSKKPSTKKHLSVWDLLPDRRDPSSNEDLMRFIDADWKARPACNVDDLRSPARISTLTWLSLLVCSAALAAFLAWLMG
jgi:hypothetical protein